jgi:Flp pilus assembly protein TadD
LTSNPYDSGTRANLGRLLAGESDWKQAAFQLQKAVQLDPSNANAQMDYAVVLIQSGNVRAGVELLEKAEHSPDPNVAGSAHAMLQQLGSR